MIKVIPLLSSSLPQAAGIGTVHPYGQVAGLHRASPSTSLDKSKALLKCQLKIIDFFHFMSTGFLLFWGWDKKTAP